MSTGSTCYYWLTNNPDNQMVIWTYFRFGFLILANVGMMIFFGWNLGKLWKKKKFDWNFETSMFLLGFLAPLCKTFVYFFFFFSFSFYFITSFF